jgi:predicted phosphodiesterase
MTNTIGILGDTHGQQRWTRFALWVYKQQEITNIHQIGDFGVGAQKADSFGNFVNTNAKNFGQHITITPGNHENYDHIDAMPLRSDGFKHYQTNIRIAPRGHRWEQNGVSMVSLGGAPSVDRMWRLQQKNKCWWAQENITVAEAIKTVTGGYADVMFTHDAPYTPTVDAGIAGNPHGFELIDLEYAAEGRKLMHNVVKQIKPTIVCHGHYHFPVSDIIEWSDGSTTQVFGLDCDGKAASIGYLNLDTLETTHATVEDIQRLYTTYMKEKN